MAQELSHPTPAATPTACLHLRSKGMCVTGELDPTSIGHSDQNCWCNQTQGALGPDDQFVNRKNCIAGRLCYVARL